MCGWENALRAARIAAFPGVRTQASATRAPNTQLTIMTRNEATDSIQQSTCQLHDYRARDNYRNNGASAGGIVHAWTDTGAASRWTLACTTET